MRWCLMMALTVGCAAGAGADPTTERPTPSADPPALRRLAEPPCAPLQEEPLGDGSVTLSTCAVGEDGRGTGYVTRSVGGERVVTLLKPFDGPLYVTGTRLLVMERRDRDHRILEATRQPDGSYAWTHVGPWLPTGPKDWVSAQALQRGDVLEAVVEDGLITLEYLMGDARALVSAGHPERAADLLRGVARELDFGRPPTRARLATLLDGEGDERLGDLLADYLDRTKREPTAGDEARLEEALREGRWLEARGGTWTVPRDQDPRWWRALRREVEARLAADEPVRPAMKFFGGLPNAELYPALTELVRPLVVAFAERGIRGYVERPGLYFDLDTPEGAVASAHLDPKKARLAHAMRRTGAGGIPGRLFVLDDVVCVDFLSSWDDVRSRDDGYRRWCAGEPRSHRLTTLMPPPPDRGCTSGQPPTDAPAEVEVACAASTGDFGCGWGGEDRALHCWGDHAAAGVPPKVDHVLEAVVRDTFVCGLLGTAELRCWGEAPSLPPIESPDWVLLQEVEFVGRAVNPWKVPEPGRDGCTARSRGPYDGGELFEVECVVFVNGPEGADHVKTMRWEGADGHVVGSPIGMWWQHTRVSDIEVSPHGLRWVETYRPEWDGRRATMGHPKQAPKQRSTVVAYLGDGEFGEVKTGEWRNLPSDGN